MPSSDVGESVICPKELHFRFEVFHVHRVCKFKKSYRCIGTIGSANLLKLGLKELGCDGRVLHDAKMGINCEVLVLKVCFSRNGVMTCTRRRGDRLKRISICGPSFSIQRSLRSMH